MQPEKGLFVGGEGTSKGEERCGKVVVGKISHDIVV